MLFVCGQTLHIKTLDDFVIRWPAHLRVFLVEDGEHSQDRMWVLSLILLTVHLLCELDISYAFAFFFFSVWQSSPYFWIRRVSSTLTMGLQELLRLPSHSIHRKPPLGLPFVYISSLNPCLLSFEPYSFASWTVYISIYVPSTHKILCFYT